MAHPKWKTFGDLLSLHDRINRLFEDHYLKSTHTSSETLNSWYPVTDIYETRDNFVFLLELPGVEKDDIKVEFSENTLTIKGERKKAQEFKEENYHRIESFSGSFKRTFNIPKDIDPKSIDARLRDGILELKVGKIEKKPSKSIPIKIK